MNPYLKLSLLFACASTASAAISRVDLQVARELRAQKPDLSLRDLVLDRKSGEPPPLPRIPTVGDLLRRGSSVIEAENLDPEESRVFLDRSDGALYAFNERSGDMRIVKTSQDSQWSTRDDFGEHARNVKKIYAFPSRLGQRIVTVAKPPLAASATVYVWSRDVLHAVRAIELPAEAMGFGSMPDSGHLVFEHRSQPQLSVVIDLTDGSVRNVRALLEDRAQP